MLLVMMCVLGLLLARGRDRLETQASLSTYLNELDLLLARGRDRLETGSSQMLLPNLSLSYSLGDAIDWKLLDGGLLSIDLITLLLARGRDRLETSLT